MDGDHARPGEVTGSGRPFGAVLAGTDGSERAEEAVRRAARLATLSRATLRVVYVIDTGRTHGADVERDADDALDRAATAASPWTSDVDARVLAGDPGEALLAEAEEHGVDLVVVGPDAGALGGAVRIGRVATHVLRQARCSVLVGRQASPGFPLRVQCGVDGSDSSTDTASLAAAVAAQAGAELRVHHVVPVFRGDDAEWTLDPGDPSPPELEAGVAAGLRLGVEPVRVMSMGRPEHALIRAARRDEVDLLVVGHRGLSGVARVLLGSVSEHVAEHATCSVLVGRPSTTG